MPKSKYSSKSRSFSRPSVATPPSTPIPAPPPTDEGLIAPPSTPTPQVEMTARHSHSLNERSTGPVVIERSPATVIPWETLAELWNEKAWFPSIMGNSIPTFANFIFWHSLILTSITPLGRWISGFWKGEIPSYWFVSTATKLLGFQTHPSLKSDIVTYKVNGTALTAATNPTMDRTWILHAVGGLTWLLISYLQIAKVPKKLHSRTGPVALLVLLFHLGCAMNILLADQQKHTTLNKVILARIPCIVITYMCLGTYKAVRFLQNGDKSALRDHKNEMMVGWIWSLSGAGPIRMVAFFLEPFGIGPLQCQAANGSLAGVKCLWPYFYRMLMIATWNYLMIGCYCKIRKDKKLTTTWIKDFSMQLIFNVFFGILGSIPGSDNVIDALLGGAANPTGWAVTYFLWVLQTFQLTLFPLLYAVFAFYSPRRLLTYTLSAVMVSTSL